MEITKYCVTVKYLFYKNSRDTYSDRSIVAPENNYSNLFIMKYVISGGYGQLANNRQRAEAVW